MVFRSEKNKVFFPVGFGIIGVLGAQQDQEVRPMREEVVVEGGRSKVRNVFPAGQWKNRNSSLKEGIMRKGLIVLLATVLAVAFALPAMADMTPTNLSVSGFYRSKAYLSNFIDGYSKPSLRTGTPGDEEQTNAFVEQRLRVRWAFGTENAQVIMHTENDMIWGDVAGGSRLYTSTGVGGTSSVGADTTSLGAQRNTGGALGADRISTEMKNIYVWFKLPDTSLDFTVGLQNQSDVYAGVLWGGADFTGIYMTGKYEPVNYKLGWGKLFENDPKKSDDMTLYVAEVDLVPAKAVKLGLNFYYLQDDTQKASPISYVSSASGASLPAGTAGNANPKGGSNTKKVYTPGVNATFKAGPATITAFAAYQWGTINYSAYQPTKSDVDIQAYMLDARADMNVGPGKMFFEGFYMSGGDNTSQKYKSMISLATNDGSPGGNSAYSRTNTVMMLASPDTINISQCIVGCSGGEMGSDLGMQGRGIWHLATGYSQSFTKQLKGETNLSYTSVTKRLAGADSSSKGNSLGTELNAAVHYNILKGLDVGLVGAYLWLGDYFQYNNGDPKVKDAYTTYARINYAF
jgi:hypothetical protein